MYIESIKLLNFRNIEYAEINPGNKINFIIGDNAQGKTNFVESIYLLSFLKSFRNNKNIEIINNNKNICHIKSHVNFNTSVTNIELSIDKDKKNYKINGFKDKKNVFKNLNTIIFHPEEVNYISSYPVFRRNLIDKSIFYTDYTYLDTFKKYLKCIKHRNKLIKEKVSDTSIWEEQICDLGSIIINKRIKYIDRINLIFSNNIFREEKYNLKYSKRYHDLNNIKDNLIKDFSKNREKEYTLGYTLVGPHKDDIIFYINNKKASVYASQGQKRSLVISFKTAQILDFKKYNGFFPILILDDMTSELDPTRKNSLLENLIANSGQVFITSTDLNNTDLSIDNQVFRVVNGNISLVS